MIPKVSRLPVDILGQILYYKTKDGELFSEAINPLNKKIEVLK